MTQNPHTPPKDQQEDEWIDNLILDLVHRGSMMRAGKTINAGMFPEARQKILDELAEARKGYVPVNAARLVTKHSKDCAALKLVEAGEWDTPWFIDGTTVWRDKRGSTHGESHRFLVVKCNSTNACPAEMLVQEESLLASLQITPSSSRSGALPKLYTQSELNQAVEEAERRGVLKVLDRLESDPSLPDDCPRNTCKYQHLHHVTHLLIESYRAEATQPPLNTKDKQDDAA